MKPLAWSHSALAGFETCPRQFEEVRVLKHYKDKMNPAAMWGDEFHRAAERYIKTKCGVGEATLPANMAQYDAYLLPFTTRAGKTLAEQKYSLTIKLEPCGFFAKDVWVRSIIDVLTLDEHVAYVDDHKTGKNRKKDMQQLIVFALMVFYHHPEIDTVHTAYHWVQLGFGEDAKDRETFYRHQMPELWEQLVPKLERYKAAFHAGIFPPKPSGLCRRFCVVESCEYYGSGTR